MDEMPSVIDVAHQVLARIVEKTCAACERNCCHQGTMMSSQDLRRLVRGLAVDEELAVRLRAGLREKAGELRADVAAARQVLRLAQAAGADAAAIAQAEARVAALEDLAQALDADDMPLDRDHLQRLLLHTALRHNLIRAFRAFPMGDGALARFADKASSFRFRGGKLAPPRCIFHSLSQGCLAGRWKPAKCANFFCAADPSLIDAICEHMDFDDFVLANVEPADPGALLAVLKAEADLGPEFHEPLVVLPVDEDGALELARAVEGLDLDVTVRRLASAPSASGAERLAEGVDYGAAMIAWLPEIAAAELYDLAIGLDRVRLRDAQRLILFAAGRLALPSVPEHRLWAEHTIAQPIGYLEVYVLRDG